MISFKVFGDRVALTSVEQTHTGTVVLPQSAAKIFDLGKVVAIGDGKLKDKTVKMHVQPGDVAVFQANAMVAHNCMHAFGGQRFLFLSQQDLIATLTGTEIKLDGFNVVGSWVLLELFGEADGLVVVPDAAKKPTRYRVLQAGQDVDKVSRGQEVVVEKTRVGKIALNGLDYGFVHDANILGVLEA